MGEGGETLRAAVSISSMAGGTGPYVHGADPLALLVGGELPPFASDLGVLAAASTGALVVIGGDGDRDEEREEEDAKDTEEGHLSGWQAVGEKRMGGEAL